MTAARKLLLTGATGFVGQQLLPILIAEGWDVYAVSRCPGPPTPGVTWCQADLLESGRARRVALEIGADALVHLAWEATPGLFWRSPDNLKWLKASLDLFGEFIEAGGRRAVFAGTCAEYDWTHERLDEITTPLNPGTLYGAAKVALYLTTKALGLQSGVQVAWARIFFLYGPHEAKSRLVPNVILSLQQGREALCGPGTAERDFLHVEDVARAFSSVLNSNYVGAVNIASGAAIPVASVITEIAEQMGSPHLVRLGARPSAEEPRRLAASSGILNELGFAPSHCLVDGLRQTIAWWNKNSRKSPENDLFAQN